MKRADTAKTGSRAARVPEQGRRATVTFRCLPAVQAQIQDAAAKSGRSASEEIERRLEESLSSSIPADARTKGLFENVAQMIAMVERATGKKWWEDELSASMCGDAVRELVSSLMPKYDPPRNKLLELVETEGSRREREAKEALWQTTLKLNAMDRAIAILRDNTEGGPSIKSVDKLSHSEIISDT